VLKGGDYVRLLGSGLRGTIDGSERTEQGALKYRFRPDPRLAQSARECYVLEGEVAHCDPPGTEAAQVRSAEQTKKEGKQHHGQKRLV